MRILIISQYFWPENFRINDLTLELKNRGHIITVLTGKPNYPKGTFFNGYSFFNKSFEFWEGIKIYRAKILPRRNGNGINLFINYLSFTFFSCLKIFSIKGNFDKIIVYQLSPGTIGFTGLLAKYIFKAPVYFYIQDIWPESLADAGGIKSNFILKLVNIMMNFFYKKSNLILVQSNGFIDFLVNKGVERNKIKYLPNTVESFYKPEKVLDIYNNQFPKGFNILFAGNIGFAQDFDTILNAAYILNEKKIDVNWVILGDGRAKDDLIIKIKKLNLTNSFYFLGVKPSIEMPFYFACADLLLVSLKKSEIFSLTIPSKVQSYMACKKPIIGNIDGIASKTIIDAGAGLCSPSGTSNILAENIEIFINKTSQDKEKFSKNSYNYFLQNFERSVVYNKLEYYLNS
jgi:glycosyltransferase involved in cell wall biosynthesis